MATVNWYNENLNRAYPFVRGTAGMPLSGPLTLLNLPDAAVVDAGFVVGPKTDFVAGQHEVFLLSLQRQGSLFFFTFASTAPSMAGVHLVFTRHVTDPDFSLQYADSGSEGLSAASLSGSHSVIVEECNEPVWSGFMVSGKMASLELLLPVDGVLANPGGACTVEPALVQNLSLSFVTQFAVANDDRVRATAPDGCPPLVFPYPTGGTYVNDRCLLGAIYFTPGYNATIRQTANGITFGAGVGQGAGQPCNEVKLFANERAPAGSVLLEGGPQCNEVLRSFNGVGGRIYNIVGGNGVSVEAIPAQHTVVIDISLQGLALQQGFSSRSESC